MMPDSCDWASGLVEAVFFQASLCLIFVKSFEVPTLESKEFHASCCMTKSRTGRRVISCLIRKVSTMLSLRPNLLRRDL
jgi:hypothetical protein